MRKVAILKTMAAIAMAAVLTACGTGVEVPPAHIGKIMTKDGYQEPIIPTSKFRLPACLLYCDRLVLMEVSDQAYEEQLNIFIPTDKLVLSVAVRTTLSIAPAKAHEMFSAISPEALNGHTSIIPAKSIYKTYASQITQTEVREYLSQYSISEIASSVEKINADLRERLTKRLQERTPYNVRYVGITNIKFPDIITSAQENAAKRREMIDQENAELQVSKVKLERQLQEAQLQRAIEEEKAKTEAMAQRVLAETVDARVLQLRELENQRAWIDKWNGQLPTTALGEHVMTVVPTK